MYPTIRLGEAVMRKTWRYMKSADAAWALVSGIGVEWSTPSSRFSALIYVISLLFYAVIRGWWLAILGRFARLGFQSR